MPADSKTEKATPKKRRDERKEGNIFQSKDVVNVVFVLVAFMSLEFLFPLVYEHAGGMMTKFLGLVGTVDSVTAQNAASYSVEFLEAAAYSILPLAFICVLVSIVAHGVQTRFLFTAKSFYPKLNRLSPLQGIKKIVSLKNFVELIKNMLKIVLLVFIVYTLMRDYLVDVIKTMDMNIASSVAFIFDLCMKMIFTVTIVFAFVAFFDYMFQRWEYERKIRMSKQEIKEEYKQTEGNPEIKGKIKELQRQRARSRMIQAVPNADVIIRNPTHYAVALAYDTERNRAPVVIAKGVDELALRIVRVGEEHGVVVIEDKPLARAIYSETDVDREIPEGFYTAVAEILVYVYRLKNKMR